MLRQKGKRNGLLGKSILIIKGEIYMKRTVSIILAFVLVLTITTVCFAEENISVTLNGNKIEFASQPVMQNDRVLVPLRKIAESLGATVTYDGETETVLAVSGSDIIMFQIGSDVIYVNSEPVKTDVVSFETNGTTFVPTRIFAEGFKCKVDWDDPTQTVIITK